MIVDQSDPPKTGEGLLWTGPFRINLMLISQCERRNWVSERVREFPFGNPTFLILIHGAIRFSAVVPFLFL